MHEHDAFIDLQHVYVARGLTTILQDVNLQVREGEHIALLGPNGCGKSTLIKTITCECYPLVRPETKVRLFGRERWDLTQLRAKMGLVSSEPPSKQTRQTNGLDAVISGYFGSSTLWPNLTVTDEMRTNAMDTLRKMQSESLAKKLVGEMSAGQQRRVMIARALVASGHKTLLLDEPSNALDLTAQKELRETMRQLAQQGTSILLITHHIADIIPEIQRVVLMADGHIVGDGPKKDLLTEKTLGNAFKTSLEVHERDGYFHAW